MSKLDDWFLEQGVTPSYTSNVKKSKPLSKFDTLVKLII